MTRITFIILILIFCKISIGQPTDTLFVYSTSGVWLREKPSINSEKILLIPYRSVINKPIDNIDTISTIGWTTDNWIRIKFDNKSGYVFKGFLSSLKFPTECDQKEYINIRTYIHNHYFKNTNVDSAWTTNRYGTGKHLTYTYIYSDSIIFEDHISMDGWCYKLISRNHNFNDGLNLFKAFSETCYTEFKKVFKNAKYFKNNKGIVNRFEGSTNWESISVWIEEIDNKGLVIEICESVE